MSSLPSRTQLTWRTSTILVGAGGLLSVILWTIPNWNLFFSTLAQFPALWQIPANRALLLILALKMCAPLLMMLLISGTIVLYQLPDGATEVSADTISQRGQHTMPVPVSVPDTRSSAVRAWVALPPLQGIIFTPHPAGTMTPPVWMEEVRTLLPAGPVLEAPLRVPEGGGSVASLHLVEHLQSSFSGTCLDDQLPPASVVDADCAVQSTLELPAWAQEPAEAGRDQADTPSASSPLPLSLVQAERQTASEARQASDQEHTPDTQRPLLSIRLLKEVSLILHGPQDKDYIIPLTMHAKRVQLLAYMGWRRSELIDRDKILEQVFGWNLPDEDATEEKLSERFDSHKKLLRRKIREIALEQVNKPAGTNLIDPEIDPFVSDSRFWGLSNICRVDDLEAIEAEYNIIVAARKEGKLIEEVPLAVKKACERLIDAYSGDFLENVIKKHPDEFSAFQGRSSWVRKPFTQYRDYYLDALWYVAEYEWQQAQRFADAGEETEECISYQERVGRAARWYQTYAMYACNSKIDTKVSFGTSERVGMSERALRRCVVLFGTLGKTDLIHQVWSAYATQMKAMSGQRWVPSKETVADVEAARAQTNAYRFPAQLFQASNEQAHVEA